MTTFLLVVAIILLLLSIPVRFHITVDGVVTLWVKWLFFTLYNSQKPKKEKPPKPKKEKSKKAKAKTDKVKKDKAKKEKQNPSLEQIKEYADLAITASKKCFKPVRKLLKRISFAEIYLLVLVGGKDAHQAALNYGKVNFAVYNTINSLNGIFTLKVKQVEITPAFHKEDIDFKMHTIIKFSPLSGILAAFNLGFIALKEYISYTKNKKTHKEDKNNGAEQHTEPSK